MGWSWRRRALPVLTVVVLALAGCADEPVTPAAPTSAPRPGLALDGADIPALELAMDTGRTSAAALTATYTGRIRAMPQLHAVLGVDPTAADQAAASDRRRAAGVRGPLEGIPVLVKDNIATGPDQPTTAGSLALVDSRPVIDWTDP